jgi:hypothetical protein
MESKIMGKGINKGSNSGSSNATEVEEDYPFLDQTIEDKNALNRNELMKLTGKELAKLAVPYSTLKLNTLESKSKSDLCDIILNKNDARQQDDKPIARSARTQGETEQFISGLLSMLDVVKHSRDDEPLHVTAKEIFKKQAIAFVDKKQDSEAVNIDKANTLLFVGVGAFIAFDAFIGIKNAPTMLSKLKGKLFKKNVDKNDSK